MRSVLSLLHTQRYVTAVLVLLRAQPYVTAGLLLYSSQLCTAGVVTPLNARRNATAASSLTAVHVPPRRQLCATAARLLCATAAPSPTAVLMLHHHTQRHATAARPRDRQVLTSA